MEHEGRQRLASWKNKQVTKEFCMLRGDFHTSPQTIALSRAKSRPTTDKKKKKSLHYGSKLEIIIPGDHHPRRSSSQTANPFRRQSSPFSQCNCPTPALSSDLSGIDLVLLFLFTTLKACP